MTEPQNTETGAPAGPYEIILSDAAMESVREMPPEAVDELAEVLGQLRRDPSSVKSRALVPFPVDHGEDRENTPVPATRSVSYLRNAVAEISPPTVAVFDEELREDTAPTDPEDKLHGLRRFLHRWIEYIAVQGDHPTARYLEAAQGDEETIARYREVVERVRREQYPDARDGILKLRVECDGNQWMAVCPITMLRVFKHVGADSEAARRAAHDALTADLLRLLTGM